MANINYYFRKMPNKENIQLAHDAVDEFLAYQSNFKTLQFLLDKYRPEIHIGGVTDDWQFAWVLHKEYFDPTYDSVVAWLHEMWNDGWMIESNNHEGFNSVDDFLTHIESTLRVGNNLHTEYPEHRTVDKVELLRDGLRFFREDFE